MTYEVLDSNFVQNYASTVVVNITCHTSVTDGIPKYRILYDDVPTALSKNHKAYHHERDMGYYYRSMWSELVVPHEGGIITCEVQDKRGSYRHTPEQNMPMLQNEEAPKPHKPYTKDENREPIG